MPGQTPIPTVIAHLTSVANLKSIARCGALYCKTRLQSEGIKYRDISNPEVQDARASTPVNCGPRGMLHEYVPFFFNPLSPMLYTKVRDPFNAIDHRGLAHIITYAQRIETSGHAFVFTDGHATLFLSDFYEDLVDLQKIDWNTMRATYWNRTDDDPDRQRRRQAEFLIHDSFPIASVDEVAVFDEPAREESLSHLTQYDLDLPVVVRPEYFYRRRYR